MRQGTTGGAHGESLKYQDPSTLSAEHGEARGVRSVDREKVVDENLHGVFENDGKSTTLRSSIALA